VGPNYYIDRVEANIKKLREKITAAKIRYVVDKRLKLAKKACATTAGWFSELNTLVRDIERREKTIVVCRRTHGR